VLCVLFSTATHIVENESRSICAIKYTLEAYDDDRFSLGESMDSGVRIITWFTSSIVLTQHTVNSNLASTIKQSLPCRSYLPMLSVHLDFDTPLYRSRFTINQSRNGTTSNEVEYPPLGGVGTRSTFTV